MTGASPSPHMALFLSPHLDDAVFSCGGTIARLAGLGWRVVVATVFTRSVTDPKGFALACQTDKGIPADVDYMALRRREDAEACALLRARTVWLDEPEAPHRGYASPRALFAGCRPDDPAPARLPEVLKRLLDRLDPHLVLGPQGVGGHIDHVLLRNALADIAGARSRRLLLWRDQPYALRHAAPAAPGSHPVVIGADELAAKRAATLRYRSQIGFQFGGAEAAGTALDAAARADAAAIGLAAGQGAELFVGATGTAGDFPALTER